MPPVRPPAVAGTFYPAEPDRLAEVTDSMLAAVAAGKDEVAPKALVVPHAGYVQSGAVAAHAFARLASVARTIQRVVLLGPSHRVHLRGMALPDAETFETPLGRVPLDKEAMARTGLSKNASAHAREHAIEVQLPFLTRILGGFQIVPITVGEARLEEVAATIEALWGGAETLILVSSDLSHYLPYHDARLADARTADRILSLDVPLVHQEACGATPLSALMLIARRRGLLPTVLEMCNSGDTGGGKAEVVGYGSFAFFERERYAA